MANPVTYQPKAGDPITRMRMLIADTSATPAFTDDELELILEQTWENEFLRIYQTHADATAATVKVGITLNTWSLQLSRTLSTAPTVPEVNTFPLRGDLRYDRMDELIAAVEALGRDWTFELYMGQGMTWGPWGRESFRNQRGARAARSRSWDLAGTGVTPLPCLQVANAKRISKIRLKLAAADALDYAAGTPAKLVSYKIGNVSMNGQAEQLRNRAAELRGTTLAGVPSLLVTE